MPLLTSTGSSKMTKLLLTLAFALALSLLAFAASFAEVPRSEFLPSETFEH
jgi:hypothetical protein